VFDKPARGPFLIRKPRKIVHHASVRRLGFHAAFALPGFHEIAPVRRVNAFGASPKLGLARPGHVCVCTGGINFFLGTFFFIKGGRVHGVTRCHSDIA
jgi:hypothetical protein